jgi:hypothetical protein
MEPREEDEQPAESRSPATATTLCVCVINLFVQYVANVTTRPRLSRQPAPCTERRSVSVALAFVSRLAPSFVAMQPARLLGQNGCITPRTPTNLVRSDLHCSCRLRKFLHFDEKCMGAVAKLGHAVVHYSPPGAERKKSTLN